MAKTVKQIVEDYLKEYGYDGLVKGSGECSCELDDLFLCGEVWTDMCVSECVAGKLTVHPAGCDCESCQEWGDPDYEEWFICPVE